MTRRDLARMAALGLLAVPEAARGQDFGQFLERAARDTLGRALTPEHVGRALTPPRDDGPQLVPVRTPDGWTLVAHRYPPAAGAARPGAMPVVLCHGLTYSAAFWDLDPSVSFARYLAGLGFDVWAIDLRGCGQSQKWVFRLDSAPDVLVGGAIRRATRCKLAPTGYTTVDPKYVNWTLDDHVTYDLPTIVRLVRGATGAPQVAWVGHSMGGIIALGHLARYQNPGIGRLVTVGSQVTMREAQLVLPFLGEMLRARERQLVGQLTPAEVAALTRTGATNLFFNTAHVSPQVYQALSMERTDIPALGLMKQYLALATEGELKDAKKQFNYARALGNLQIPMLISCGAVDRFAPPVVQKDVYDRVGTADKTLLVFGRAQGFPADSGHDDTLVGLTSQQQVYPLLARWLLDEKIA